MQVLKQCGDDLTRANVMRQAASLHGVVVPMLLPGISINTRPTRFAPINQEQMVRFNGTSLGRFGDVRSPLFHPTSRLEPRLARAEDLRAGGHIGDRSAHQRSEGVNQ